MNKEPITMLNTSITTPAESRGLAMQAQRAADPAAIRNEKANESETPRSSRAVARDQLNVQILQSSAEVSLQAGNQSQTLVFRAAIDRINEFLAPTLGPDAIQGKMSEDNSAEATAGRILSLSTGFFDAYAAQRKGDDPDQVAKDFVSLIRGGFEKGFKEATDILQSLKVFSGDIESGVMKTFELVNKGYDDFLASKLTPVTEKPAEAVAA
jgi:hypothetical protein